MKHIKPFNENKISDLDKAKDFCETYLANLLDDDRYELELLDLAPFEAISLKLWRKISVARDIIKWEHVKDHLIPFLFVLNKEYKVISLSFDRYVSPLGSTGLRKSSREVQMDIQDVINDDYEIPEKFYQIKIEFFE